MEKAASLFRVFDLAFFLPGALLLVACWNANFLPDVPSGSTAALVMAAIEALLIAYLLGLACHAYVRIFLRWIEKCAGLTGEAGHEPWYRRVDEKSQDLATYFWYLRSTCWNVAVALGFITGIAWTKNFSMCHRHGGWLPMLLLIPALIWLGYDYDRALAKCAHTGAWMDSLKGRGPWAKFVGLWIAAIAIPIIIGLLIP